jgi:hypothetical protein
MADGLDIATAAHAFKVAFKTAARTALDAGAATYTDAVVVFGRPTSFLDSSIVALTKLSTGQEGGPMSGTNRARDETIALEVIISCFEAGGEEAEVVASARAYGIVRVIERHVRFTDTTVGDTVRQCALTQTESDGMTGANVVKHGRNIFLTATFEALVRITS